MKKINYFYCIAKATLPTSADFIVFKCSKYLLGSEEHDPPSPKSVGENISYAEVGRLLFRDYI